MGYFFFYYLHPLHPLLPHATLGSLEMVTVTLWTMSVKNELISCLQILWYSKVIKIVSHYQNYLDTEYGTQH